MNPGYLVLATAQTKDVMTAVHLRKILAACLEKCPSSTTISPPIDHDQPCKRCLETERNVEELSEENKRLRKEIKCEENEVGKRLKEPKEIVTHTLRQSSKITSSYQQHFASAVELTNQKI
ncbi:uncharacterized protein LOC135339833 [Halichondria panicea]|uniref:uncharacterized protein LOC135339833 n=1 Tax=Halichondria panicea TaxID=6063 RepID=UPI00312BAC22